MRVAPLFLIAAAACAQQSAAPAPAPVSQTGQTPLSQKDADQLATRMLQLMESTAVATPGLVQASDPLKQNTQLTLAAMQRTPLNAALTYQFLTEVKAYLALADSIPRPSPFPAAADQQYAELRDSLGRIERHFAAMLQTQNQVVEKRDSDPDNLKRYADADSKLPPPAKAMPRVIFLGDSITDGWRLNEYFTGRDFVNRGIGGQTTIQMLARFRQDVVPLSPKIVVILAGTNDIAAGISATQIEENLATMGELAKAHGIKSVFASILPVSDYHKDADPAYQMTINRPPATIQAINRWIQSYCLSQGVPYMDYYTAMVDPSGHMQADLSDDGLHPNAKGYRVMSPVALDVIGRALGSQTTEQNESGKRRFGLLTR
jgi:lysophospholipase L1-like esterase